MTRFVSCGHILDPLIKIQKRLYIISKNRDITKIRRHICLLSEDFKNYLKRGLYSPFLLLVRWFHPAARVANDLLSGELQGTYLVRPSGSSSKGFSLEVKGEFHIEKLYIKRAKNGWFYAIGIDKQFIKIEQTLPKLMPYIKSHLKDTPYALVKPCPKPFFLQPGCIVYCIANKSESNAPQEVLLGYFADLEFKDVISDSALLSTIGTNKNLFCSLFQETANKSELFNSEAPHSEIAVRILKVLFDELVPLQALLEALIQINTPKIIISRVVDIATRKGLKRKVQEELMYVLPADVKSSAPQQRVIQIPRQEVVPVMNTEIPTLKTVDDVVKWFENLGLATNYESAIRENAFDGIALRSIEERDDIKELWQDLKVIKLGDKLKIKKAIKNLLLQK